MTERCSKCHAWIEGISCNRDDCPFGGVKDGDSSGTPLFNASEIASLRRQLSASSSVAVAVAKRHGVKRHPRVVRMTTPRPSRQYPNETAEHRAARLARRRERENMRQGGQPLPEPWSREPSPEALAESERAHAGRRGLNETLMGDPRPGRSALDKRMALEKSN